MSSKALNIAIILTAYDKATRVINDATSKASKELKRLKNDSMDAFGKGMAQIGAGVAIATPLVVATKAAMDFEEKMADVAKVLDVSIGSDKFKSLSKDAQSLAFYLGKTPADAAALMAALSAGGVAESDLATVTKMAGEMGVAFDMTSEDAGKSFVKIKNALGTTIPETKKVADAINHLSNLMASEAPELVNFMASGGSSVAAAFGIAGKDAAAFGSTMISMGKSSSEAATIMERFAKGIFKDDAVKKVFDKAGGGAQGLVAVLEQANKKGGYDFFKDHKFGEYSSDFALMAKNIKTVKEALGYVNKEGNYANSVNKEFHDRTQTTAFAMAKLKTALSNVAINLGSVFLPVVAKVATMLSSVTSKIAKWAEENPRLAKTLGFAVAAVSGFLLFAGAINIVKAAWLAMRVAMMTNPVGLILMAIAVLAAVIMANWDKIGPFFTRLWARVKATFSAAWVWIKNLLQNYTPVGLIYKHWDTIVAYFTNIWEKVKNTFTAVWEWIKGLADKFFQAGVNIVNSIGDGIEAEAQKLLDKVKKLAKDIRDFFPFSPAKTGPLKDIHKIKLIETIAANIKAAPMVNAINGVAGAARNAMDVPMSPAMAGGGMSINYSPTIHIAGGGPAAKLEFSQMLKAHKDELMRIIQGETERKARKSY